MNSFYFDLLNLIINGLTAIGTLSAVIVALFLAFKKPKAQLKLSMRHVVMMSDKSEFVEFSCINVGALPVRIDSMSLLLGTDIGMLIKNNNNELPKILNYSEYVSVYQPYEPMISNILQQLKKYLINENYTKISFKKKLNSYMLLKANVSVANRSEFLIDSNIINELSYKYLVSANKKTDDIN